MEHFEDEMQLDMDDQINFQDCVPGLVDEGIILEGANPSNNPAQDEQDAFFDFEDDTHEMLSASGSPTYPNKQTVNGNNASWMNYYGEEDEDDSRTRVVRFADDEDMDDTQTPNLLIAGGLAAGSLVAGGFANMEKNTTSGLPSSNQGNNRDDILSNQDSDASIDMFDIFDEGTDAKGYHSTSKASSGGFDDDDDTDDDDDDLNSIDSQEEQEKEIRRKMMFAVAGVGVMGLLGLGFKKVMSKLNGNSAEDAAEVGADAAADAIDDATTIAVHLSSDAATQASFNASASQSNFAFAGAAGANNNAAAMTGAQ
jgi:hypothetical protein